MLGEIDTYWVVMCKDDRPLYAVAGPFGLWEEASDSMDSMEDPGGRCYLRVLKSAILVVDG